MQSPYSSSNALFPAYALQNAKLSFRRRETIFLAGDPSDYVFFIEKGNIKLTVTSADGKEAAIAILSPGDFLGEAALESRRIPRSTSAVALADGRVARIGRELMIQLLRTDQNLCQTFVRHLIRQAEQLKQNIGTRLLYGGEQRLAQALLSMADFHEGEKIRALPNFSQQELANMIGITRQRVNALMQRFRKFGFVEYGHGLKVHDSIRRAMRRHERNV